MKSSTIGKILIVDDEVELKNILVEVLASQGYETLGFTSGEAAIAALREESFDVLLTDLMMGGMDGIATVREAIETDPNLICIMMTGQGTIQTAVDAMKVGAFDYVLKPFRLQTMLPVLTRAMNARHLRLENVQLREAVAIHELSETIAFTLDPKTVLSKLADGALVQSEADEVSILLPTSDGRELYVAAVRGAKRERLLGERIPLHESISSWVARERTPLILNGEVHDERFVALWPRSDIRSAVSVPMQVANKLVGIINLNMTNRLRPFTLGQMKALTILAGTAAAALESASLHNQVQEAEKKYRSIFENAVEGIFQSNADRQFLTVNPALARILGFDSPAEVIDAFVDIGQQLYARPELALEVTRTLGNVGVVQGFEFEACRKDGERIWLSLNMRLVRDQTGAEAYREGTLEDITDRKRAEAERARLAEEIEKQRQRLNNIVGSVPGMVWEAWGQPDQATQRIDFVSDYVESLLGYSVQEWLATPNFWLTIVHPADREEAARVAGNAFSSGKSATQEFRWLRKDGSSVWVESNYVVIKDGAGRPVGLRGVNTDISERKRASELLQESERRFRQLADNINEVFWIVDPNTREMLYVSPAYEQIWGRTPAALYARPGSFIDALHPEDKDEILESAERQKRGERADNDYRILRPDGSIRWIHDRAFPIKDKDGAVSRIVGIAEDITERKHAAAQRERLAVLVDASPDFIGYADPKTAQIKYINKHGRRMCGIGENEDLGEIKISDVHPAWMNERMADVILPAAVRDGVWEGDAAFLHRSGREIPVSMVLMARKDANGEVDIFYTVSRDITERKQVEDALRASEESYRDLVENAHDIIYSHDLEGNYTSMNQAGAQITGYTIEESLALNESQTIAPEYQGRVREMLARKLAGERVTAYEMEIVAKDGHRITVEANTKLVFHDGVPIGVQGIARDVTERKLLEEQLRQSQKMEAIGQLAGGVAHDFNNLLTAINGYSGLALQRIDADHPLRSYLEEIKKAGDRAANLTRQLLAFGRKQILQPLPINLNDIVTDMNKMLRRLIGEDIVLTARLDSSVKKIKADPGQIEQVLMNLVVNARDAMPLGGNLTIETASVELDQDYADRHMGVVPGQFVMLAVSDTGTGMDDLTQAKIFDPFFTTKEKGKGTGLGLSTVYGIIKQSGGSIWVYSECGHGTTFKVYLPQMTTEPQKTEAIVALPEPRGVETILLVEDEDVVRGLAKQILEQSGYTVLAAARGEEAIRLCLQSVDPIHMVLTDVVMPETSGKEVADRLRELRPGLRVLFMSGYTDAAIVHHGVLDSNIEFIQKPFTPVSLIRKVREVLDSEVLVSD